MAPLPRPHPRRHLPQLALHRGLRLHARQGEPGGGGGARGGGWQRLPLTPPPFSFSPSPPARRWRRPASCTAPARTAPTWRSASSASRSWRAGSPTTTRCEERGRCPGGEGAGKGGGGGASGAGSPPGGFLLLCCREEHKKHSAGCAFVALQKDPASLTLQEFLKLDKERMKNAIVCMRFPCPLRLGVVQCLVSGLFTWPLASLLHHCQTRLVLPGSLWLRWLVRLVLSLCHARDKACYLPET